MSPPAAPALNHHAPGSSHLSRTGPVPIYTTPWSFPFRSRPRPAAAQSAASAAPIHRMSIDSPPHPTSVSSAATQSRSPPVARRAAPSSQGPGSSVPSPSAQVQLVGMVSGKSEWNVDVSFKHDDDTG